MFNPHQQETSAIIALRPAADWQGGRDFGLYNCPVTGLPVLSQLKGSIYNCTQSSKPTADRQSAASLCTLYKCTLSPG